MTKRLVIDADVASASGAEEAEHPTPVDGQEDIYPTSKHCRDFLKAVRSSGHRLVLSPEAEVEWLRHASRFSLGWLTTMERFGKVVRLPQGEGEWRAEAAECVATGAAESVADRERQELLKDCHLIDAAWANDYIVCSHDKKAKRRFVIVCRTLGEVGDQVGEVAWINPDNIVEEQPIEWAEAGAPLEERRLLKNCAP